VALRLRFRRELPDDFLGAVGRQVVDLHDVRAERFTLAVVEPGQPGDMRQLGDRWVAVEPLGNGPLHVLELIESQPLHTPIAMVAAGGRLHDDVWLQGTLLDRIERLPIQVQSDCTHALDVLTLAALAVRSIDGDEDACPKPIEAHKLIRMPG